MNGRLTKVKSRYVSSSEGIWVLDTVILLYILQAIRQGGKTDLTLYTRQKTNHREKHSYFNYGLLASLELFLPGASSRRKY